MENNEKRPENSHDAATEKRENVENEKQSAKTTEPFKKQESVLEGIVARNRHKLLPSSAEAKTSGEMTEDDPAAGEKPEAAETGTEESEQTEKMEQPLEGVVISEKDADEFGYLKTFVGKPVTEVMKAYDNLNREFTKKSQELKYYKQQTQMNAIEQPAEPEEEIDPAKDPEGYKARQEAIIQRKMERVLAPVIQQSVKQQAEKMKRELGARLPEGAGVEETINRWKMKNRDHLNFYAMHPDKWLESIEQMYKAENYEKLKEDYEKKSADEAAKKAGSMLKESSRAKVRKGSGSTNQRPEERTGSPTVRKIIERNRKKL